MAEIRQAQVDEVVVSGGPPPRAGSRGPEDTPDLPGRIVLKYVMEQATCLGVPLKGRAPATGQGMVHLAHTGILLAPELLRTILEVRNEIHSQRDALLDDSGSADPADSGDADDFAEPLE